MKFKPYGVRPEVRPSQRTEGGAMPPHDARRAMIRLYRLETVDGVLASGGNGAPRRAVAAPAPKDLQAFDFLVL